MTFQKHSHDVETNVEATFLKRFCASCVRTELRNYGPEKTPYLETFHAVISIISCNRSSSATENEWANGRFQGNIRS